MTIFLLYYHESTPSLLYLSPFKHEFYNGDLATRRDRLEKYNL
jgi:hypothetical protein